MFLSIQMLMQQTNLITTFCPVLDQALATVSESFHFKPVGKELVNCWGKLDSTFQKHNRVSHGRVEETNSQNKIVNKQKTNKQEDHCQQLTTVLSPPTSHHVTGPELLGRQIWRLAPREQSPPHCRTRSWQKNAEARWRHVRARARLWWRRRRDVTAALRFTSLMSPVGLGKKLLVSAANVYFLSRRCRVCLSTPFVYRQLNPGV